MIAAVPELLYTVLPLLAVLLFCLFWGLRVWRRELRRGRELDRLRDAWGKPVDRARDFAFYPTFLKARDEAHEDRYLDDRTWQDLNLDLVFADLDRTHSLPGEIELYRAIRVPEETPEVLEARDEVISLFQSKATARTDVQLELSQLGRTLFDLGILELLWGKLPPRSRFTPLYRLLTTLVVACVAVSILLGLNGLPCGKFAFVSLGVLYAINFSIHYCTRRILEERIRSIRYLSKMIVAGRRLSGLGIAGLEDSNRRLERYTSATKAIPSATVALVPERGGAFELVDLMQEHLSILLLVEVRAFYAVLKEIKEHRAHLQGLFRTIGELDALQAIASYRKGLGSYCKPEFAADGLLLEVEGAFHPLLESPVPNSIAITGNGCIVTGSNMSGKSTFLRTLGVCAVLAQSAYTCPAAAYRGSIFRVASSISPVDDLMEGKSFYYVEAERLLEMIRSSQGAMPALCLVDELLRGTNSTERLAASEEILSYLAKNNAVVVVATHDVELVDRLTRSYESFHFSDHVDADGLRFDYLLRPGRATTTNAIRLLEHLHYPDEIVENARNKAFGGPKRGSSSE